MRHQEVCPIATAEIVRVAKGGAKIVIGDEGLAPGKEKTWFGHRLLKMNALFVNKPPRELVPEQVKDFRLNWIWRGTFYVMDE